jgi:adenosylcobyric acid synthase
LSVAAIMMQGTGSDVGKSLIVAGLCRAYTRLGLAVRPFKPQNMSNNAAVLPGGGEIGRAQALQARACGVAPSFDMNPVLLKPETDTGAQIVVHGQVRGTAKAREFQSTKSALMPAVLESFSRLSAEADLVVVEGAGSPAEINLPGPDLANMGFADAADVPALLVGDIDRGGVIASIVGTMNLLTPAARARMKGYIVNKFRGDPELFEGGLVAIGARTGLESMGIVPYFAEAGRLPAEDAVAVEKPWRAVGPRDSRPIRVAVPVLSRIANFDDFDPLATEPDVALDMVAPGRAIPGDADLIILPGSKSTLGDLAFLRAQGWDIDILAHHRQGRAVLGICGGYQMLGRNVRDPDGIEGRAGSDPGLGLLDVETKLDIGKTLTEAEGIDAATGERVTGFEMHMGRTTGPDTRRPMFHLDGDRPDGAVSPDGRVRGAYLHGMFSADGFRHAFLDRIRTRTPSGLNYEAEIDDVLDRLAGHLERHLDVERILEVARAR